MTLTFYDAFHGIGGFRYGLEQAGMECVGGCEIDKYACKAYGVINNDRCEPNDIRRVIPERLPDFDVFVFGWPCQDNSIAGKRNGQTEGTRSGLLFEAARILRAKKPRYFIAENVEGLFSVNDGLDFYQTIRLFADLGYDCQWQLLNTRWFLPQNRERIFFVGHLRGERRPEVFPITEADFETVGERGNDSLILRWQNSEQGAVLDDIAPALRASGGTDIRKKPHVLVSPVLTPERPEKQQNGRRFKEPGDPMFTLTAQDKHGVAIIQQNQQRQVTLKDHAGAIHQSMTNNQSPKVTDGHSIRKLTPLECFRLQGYPDEWFYKCKEAGISDSQLYKMAGNGVSSPVAREIGNRLMKGA